MAGDRGGFPIILLLLAGLALAGLALILPAEEGRPTGGVTTTVTETVTETPPLDPFTLCDVYTERLVVNDPDEGGMIYDLMMVVVLDPFTLCDVFDVELVVDYVPGRPLGADKQAFLIVEVADQQTGERLMREEITTTEPTVIVNIPDAWHGREILVTVYNYYVRG